MSGQIVQKAIGDEKCCEMDGAKNNGEVASASTEYNSEVFDMNINNKTEKEGRIAVLGATRLVLCLFLLLLPI